MHIDEVEGWLIWGLHDEGFPKDGVFAKFIRKKFGELRMRQASREAMCPIDGVDL